jgi:hypothetical protein
MLPKSTVSNDLGKHIECQLRGQLFFRNLAHGDAVAPGASFTASCKFYPEKALVYDAMTGAL